MKWFILFIPFLIISCGGRSTPSVCEILKIDNCNNSKRGLSRSAGASLPSVNSAAFNNPAAISLSRGLGIESIHYAGEAQLGIVSGTGRVGAAISNFPNDGTFFGNTAIESQNAYRLRRINGEKLKEDKLVLSGGMNLFGAKKKKGLRADIGVMYRNHTEADKAFGGGGLTLTFNQLFSVGFASYKDISYEDLRGETIEVVDENGDITEVTLNNDPLYLTQNAYRVDSYVAGLKFSNIAIDYIRFITVFDDKDIDTAAESSIYNVSYFYKKWIFSYGRRFEKSYKEEYQDEKFITKENKSDTFLGAQYATNNGFLLGAFINYYLVGDLSLGLTYFF